MGRILKKNKDFINKLNGKNNIDKKNNNKINKNYTILEIFSFESQRNKILKKYLYFLQQILIIMELY